MTMRAFDYDPITRVRQYFVPTDEQGSFKLVSVQDVEPTLEYNFEKRKLTDAHTRWGDGQMALSIPAVVTDQLMREGILFDEDRFRAWCNSDASLPWRTRQYRRI